MEEAGGFLHLASWWCKETCCRRSGIHGELGRLLLDIDMGIGRKPHSFQ